MLRAPKIAKKIIMVSPHWYNSFDIFVVALQKVSNDFSAELA